MKARKLYLQYLGTYKFQNKLWLVNGGFNGLFSIDLNDFSVEYRRSIPYLANNAQWPYYGNIQCAYGGKLFLFPFQCSQIMVYDIQGNDIQGIPIIPENGSDTYMTAGIFQKDNRVWIFPGDMSAGIFIFDLETMTLKKDIELNVLLKDVGHIYNYENVISLNEQSVALLSETKTIIQVNILQKKIIGSKYFAEDFDIWNMQYDGKNFWLLPYESTDLYEWYPDNDQLVRYTLLEQDAEWIDIPGVPYINIVFEAERIILLPSRLKFLMEIDKETHRIRKAVDYPEGFQFVKNQFFMKRYPAFGAFDRINNKLLLHPMLGNMLLIYDVEKNHISGKELAVTQDRVPYLDEVIIGQGYERNGIYIEKEGFGGIEMLILLVYNRHGQSDIREEAGTGNRIHHAICKGD